MSVLSLPCGKVGTVEFNTAKIGVPDIDQLPPIVKYLVMGRLTTVLLDCHAGISIKELGAEKAKALSTEAVNKKIASLYAGEIREFGGGGGRTTDPVESRMWEIVEVSCKVGMRDQYGAT